MSRTISLDADILDFINYQTNYVGVEDVPDSKIQRLKKIMKTGIMIELTDKQKSCMLKRYVDEKPVVDIANEMGIKPVTVYKHIRTAKKRIARLYAYI